MSAPSSAWRVRTGSSRSCRTIVSTPSGFTRSPTEGRRPSTLTTASSITQTGTPPLRRRRRRRSDSYGEGVMSDESVVTIDDQSHYEISLTAGQAFIAFVLLLLSLAASFAFGLMIGKSQGDERLVVRKEPSVVTEASAIPKKQAGKIVELGVADQDFKAPVATPVVTETTSSGGQAPSPVQA